MKRISFLIAGAAMLVSLSSCNKDENGSSVSISENDQPICVTSGTATKAGYVDGTTFYEKQDSSMHKRVDSTPRTMMLSAYRSPDEGQTFAAGNYFVGAKFESDGAAAPNETWRHTPAYYWPLSSKLDFLAYSSSVPFAAKDAKWDAANASNQVILTFDRARCQDDVLFAAQSMKSSAATDITGSTYTTAQPVNMTFSHSQAWLEFQLSVAAEGMKDKIAIKEIILKGARDRGVLTVTHTSGADCTAAWNLGEGEDIVFDDNYGVYGHSKTVDEYTAENDLIATREAELATAVASGNADAITVAENNLQAAKDALAAAVANYPVVNAVNAVGVKNDPEGTAAAGAEIKTDCVFLDMLLPEQDKCDIVIKYVLAGRPEVLTYKYSVAGAGKKWQMGRKYIYDIDFVISEITVAPTVTEWSASFDGSDLKPVELI